MDRKKINRSASRTILVLSAIALVAVLSGYIQPPQPDEGAAAHIFQLSIVALVPMLMLFSGTADWRQPWHILRSLTLPTMALLFAFAALYYLEHYR